MLLEDQQHLFLTSLVQEINYKLVFMKLVIIQPWLSENAVHVQLVVTGVCRPRIQSATLDTPEV